MTTRPAGPSRTSPRTTHGVVLTGLVLFAVACDASVIPPLPAADAFEFRLDTQPPLVVRWPTGSTVRVHVVDGGAAGPSALRDALAAGMAGWNAQGLSNEFALAEADDPASADVLLAWSDAALPVQTDGCPRAGGRATTTFCLDGSRLYRFPLTTADNSRITMLVTIASLLATTPSVLDATVTHELGHVLGIMRHSDQADDLMWAGDLARGTPSTRDAATLKALYRTRADVSP
jgi:predicted Zn-dependent protease